MTLRAGIALVVASSAALGLDARTPQGQATASAPRVSTIAGRVLDGATGRPVPAAVVTLGLSGQRQQATTPRVLTDTSGRYVFPGVTKGTYTLNAAKPGWLDGSFGRLRPSGTAVPLEVAEREHRSDIDLRLWRVAVITGRVVDDAGDPLVDVDVRAFQRSFPAGRARWTFATRAITDDRGVYRLTMLQPGSYLVVVPATITSGPPSIRRGAQPSAFLQSMMAIGAAPVSFDGLDLPAPNGLRLASSLNLTSPPEPNRAWSTYPTTFHPSALGVHQTAVITVASGEVRTGVDVAIRLTPTYEVSGTVVGDTGAPAGALAVHLIPADSADNPVIDTATAVTDDAGAFTFYGVPPGDYVARVVKTPDPESGVRLSTCSMGGGTISFVCMTGTGPAPPLPPTGDLLHADARLAVRDRPLRNVAMTLSKGARVRGRAEFIGTSKPPAASALGELSIWLDRADGTTYQPPGGFDFTLPARLTPELAFVTPSTWPGRHVIRVTGIPDGWSLRGATKNERELAHTAFDLQSDVNDVVLTFVDRPSTLEGTVHTAAGQPDSTAVVLLFPADADERIDTGRSSRRVQSASTLGGRFSMPAPPAGVYLVVAIPDAQAHDWRDPAVLSQLESLAQRLRIADAAPPAVALRTRTRR